jgi:anti-sigma factor ChrR (cupin superfamily)
MPSDSHAVDTSSLPWRPTPFAGVEWKKLRHDPATGQSAVLLRFAPGASYGSHRHPAGEQYFVLEGSVDDGSNTLGSNTWGPGSYVHHPPGSVHKPRSENGCLLFVTLPEPIEIVE